MLRTKPLQGSGIIAGHPRVGLSPNPGLSNATPFGVGDLMPCRTFGEDGSILYPSFPFSL